MPASSQQERRRGRRRWARRGLELLLVGATTYLAFAMVSAVGWSALAAELRRADAHLLGLAALLLGCRWLVWNARWRLALAAASVHVGSTRSLFALLAGAALNHLTPAFRVFGGLVRARYVGGRSGQAFDPGLAAVVFDQIVNQTVMGALAAAAFAGLSWRLGRPGQLVAGAVVVGSIVLLVPLLYRRLKRLGLLPLPANGPAAAGPLVTHSRDVVHRLLGLLRDRRLLIAATLLALLLAAFNLAAAWVAFVALGHRVPLTAVFYAVSLGVVVGAISGTPGGGLTTEAAMVTCYALLGVDRPLALAATLLYRGLHYGLLVLLGLPALVTLETLHRRGAQSS